MLRLIFKLNENRALTTFRTVNHPAEVRHSRGNFDLFVHEMVHVYQFEKIGSIYIWQTLAALQSEEGYRHGGWEKLTEDHQNGRRLGNYNREQQGQIAQYYYDDALTPDLSIDNPTRLAFQPFINDLQTGAL
ncbi:MAG: hypothetical protein QGI76_09330 [Dehalococcoidia bacterium]|nr:hypothetical protein [Dehalococcoidia bacterium]